MEYMFLIILLVFMIAMMFFQTRKAKKQQQERQDFWANLEPGTEIITIGGLIGKVVEVDKEYEEIVLDSDGSLLRFSFRAVSKQYVRPAYVHDDEVDENGNPLPDKAPAQLTNTQEATEVTETAEVVTEASDDRPADGEARS